MRKILIFGLLLAASACSGATVEVGGYTGDRASPDGGAETVPDAAPIGTTARVEIHVRASTSPVPHDDGLSGQTPSVQKIGIRKLTMMTSDTDPSPLVVFDHGASAVEAGLDDGDDTVVATVPAASLKAGNYTIARVAIAHARYRVAATMHGLGQAVPGTFENLHVLSDGATVDGETFDKGHYRFTFEVGGTPLATQSGEDSPLPLEPSVGGITMDTEGSETAYVFPISVPVEPALRGDVRMIFEVNTYDNFRWEDEAMNGYARGVFDVTPSSFEPVKSFGANSFHVFAELARVASASLGTARRPTEVLSPGAGTIFDAACRSRAADEPSWIEPMVVTPCPAGGARR